MPPKSPQEPPKLGGPIRELGGLIASSGSNIMVMQNAMQLATCVARLVGPFKSTLDGRKIV